MITLFVFYIHIVAAVVLFTKHWQDGDWKEGLLSVGFLSLVFSVGWSISTFILKILIDEKGFGVWLDRDALALTLLLLIESVFFYFQLKKNKRKFKTA